MSVVIAAWDSYAGGPLTEAAASVGAQSEPAQVVIVDNASSVPLAAVPGAETVRLRSRVSRGAARNAGLARVRTPLVVFLDADDLLQAGALAEMVGRIEADPLLSACAFSILEQPAGRRHRRPRRIARALARAPVLFATANAIWSLLPTQGATIIATEQARAAGGYGDTDHGEDWVLAVSLAFRGRIAFDRRIGLIYRSREDSPGRALVAATILLASARGVRARLRDDPAVPHPVRTLLPAIAVAQWLAVLIAHPLYRFLRGALRPSRG